MKDDPGKGVSFENGTRFVDLTYAISPESDVWPGEERPEFIQTASMSDEGVNISRFCMNSHTETHMDSPAHFIDGGTTIDELPFESFTGSAVIYRSGAELRGGQIELEAVRESDLEITEGDVFIVDNGLQRLKKDERYYENFPTPSTDLLDWLVDRDIKCYGTDCPSIDPLHGGQTKNHELLLSEEIPIVENLANLGQLDGQQGFMFLAFPLRLEGLEASPCRAAAIEGSDLDGIS